jgi:hypothetical protein
MRVKPLILFVSLLSITSPSAAQMVSAKNPASVVAAMQAKGYQAELGTEDGAPRIASGAGGLKLTIFFGNCEKGANCTTISFVTGFTDLDNVSLPRINDWNRQNRFARAYLDEERDPMLVMDVDLDHQGIPSANFAEYLDIWSSLAPKYLDFLKKER